MNALGQPLAQPHLLGRDDVNRDLTLILSTFGHCVEAQSRSLAAIAHGPSVKEQHAHTPITNH